MDYSHIQSFLDKFKKIVQTDDVLKGVIISAFQKHLMVVIKKEDITFKGTVLCIKSSSIFKNEILFKKNLVLKTIEEYSGKRFTDIR